MIKDAISTIISGDSLSEQEMIEVMSMIMDGAATPAQIAAFVTALRMKGETVQEICGAAKVMRLKASRVPVTCSEDIVDTCGTGGDGARTFNISTAAALVACGAGLRIAKHGNRSISSISGSADAMEKLGVNITIPAEIVGRCIDTVGIGFLFAPVLHQAMKHAAPVRKEIGIRSIFNILGPLTNPAGARIQLLGVYEEKLTETLARVLQQLGLKRALVVYGRDGLDEITLGGDTVVCELKEGTIKRYTVNPAAYGLPTAAISSLRGGTPHENAAIITRVLRGERGPHRDIVCLNAAAAIMASGRAEGLDDGLTIASASIDSGSALNKLNQLKEFTHSQAML